MIDGVGYGSVFKITTNGQFSILYNFGSVTTSAGTPADGAYPNALTLGSDGNLYGTTESGGLSYYTNGSVITNYYSGSVFKLTTAGHLTTLYNFGTATDLGASQPAAALVEGMDHRFYGTTAACGGTGTNSFGEGNGAGIVFAISTNGSFTLLNYFVSTIVTNNKLEIVFSTNGNYETNVPVVGNSLLAGGNPAAPLIQGTDGNLYGTSSYGGALTNIFHIGTNQLVTNVNSGYGTIYRVSPTTGNMSLLYVFGTSEDPNGDPLDGAAPNGLVQDPNGYLYGTTEGGGTNDDYNLGFYGSYFSGSPGEGDGTLFRISPSGPASFTTLLSFEEEFGDGYNPVGPLILGTNGNLYGVASAGGANKRGAIFIYRTNGTTTNIVWLTKTSGAYGGNLQSLLGLQSSEFGSELPAPSFLAPGLNGNLYGTTTDDGTNGDGTIFVLSGTPALTNSPPLAVTLVSPINGQSFATGQVIAFSATASGPNSIQTLALFTNGVLAASVSASSLSVSLTNLQSGSYAVSASATDATGSNAFSTVAHITVNAPGTQLIDFEAVNAGSGPVSGAGLNNYLANYGVTVSGVTPGSTLAVQDYQNIFNGALTLASSGVNLLTQTGTNGAISYTLGFATPCTQVSWTRTELLAGDGGVVAPEWTAYAYDSSSNELAQIGESQTFSTTNIPAARFSLTASNIAFVTFIGDNNLSEFDTLPLDDLLLSTNAVNPTPVITLTSNNFFGDTPGQITLDAVASEANGAIARVDFYENQVLRGSVSGAPSSPFDASLPLSYLAAGAYTFYAVATDTNNVTHASSTMTVTVVSVPGGPALINFDSLATANGAVGGAQLSNYLAGFGVNIPSTSLGTRLEAINQDSFSGNDLPMPSSPPNLFTQVGSSQPVVFRLNFATNLQSVTFTRVGIDTNGPSGITHPAWTATILDSSNNELEAVSEPLIYSTNDIPPRTFTLAASGSNIAGIRFNSDSQQTAAFAAVLLDDVVLNLPATNPLSITLATNGATLTAPANIVLTATAADTFTNIARVDFYSGPTLIGSASQSNYTFTASNILNGNYTFTANVVDSYGYSLFSAPVSVTVSPGGSANLVNFDSLQASVSNVSGAPLAAYLGSNGMAVGSNSPSSTVAVENETNVAGVGYVTASSLPNILSQLGSNGPMSFTVDFTNLLTEFGFTRPELLANPSVTHPGWQVRVFDPLGNVLASAGQSLIASYTNVPAQSFTLNGPGIASVEFDSDGNGLTTFPALLLDDFILTGGLSVVITNPLPGQVFTSSNQVAIAADVADTSGTVTNMSFYYGGTNLIGSAQTSPFSVLWSPPSNGQYVLTAVALDTASQSLTSAPVSITVATGFAIVTPPVSQTVAEGSNVSFSVTTTATNAVSYQWSANGMALASQTNSVLTLSAVTQGSAGNYVVVATDNGVSVTSQPPAVLTVLEPPVATTPIVTPATVDIGNTLTLQEVATPTNSPVPFTYQWRLNGTGIPGATNSIYVISNAQPLNSGNYQVVVGEGVAFSQSPAFNVTVHFGTGVVPTTNDTIATSLAFNPLVNPIAGNNSSSPASGEVASIAGKPAGKLLWYNWTAGFTGIISMTTLGSSFDTLLGVYTGTNAASLEPVAQDDDSAASLPASSPLIAHKA